VRLERATEDIVRYLPDDVCFFSEVVGHGYMSLNGVMYSEIIVLLVDEKGAATCPIYKPNSSISIRIKAGQAVKPALLW
jgi:hypothetical protein